MISVHHALVLSKWPRPGSWLFHSWIARPTNLSFVRSDSSWNSKGFTLNEGIKWRRGKWKFLAFKLPDFPSCQNFFFCQVYILNLNPDSLESIKQCVEASSGDLLIMRRMPLMMVQLIRSLMLSAWTCSGASHAANTPTHQPVTTCFIFYTVFVFRNLSLLNVTYCYLCSPFMCSICLEDRFQVSAVSHQ